MSKINTNDIKQEFTGGVTAITFVEDGLSFFVCTTEVELKTILLDGYEKAAVIEAKALNKDE